MGTGQNLYHKELRAVTISDLFGRLLLGQGRVPAVLSGPSAQLEWRPIVSGLFMKNMWLWSDGERGNGRGGENTVLAGQRSLLLSHNET